RSSSSSATRPAAFAKRWWRGSRRCSPPGTQSPAAGRRPSGRARPPRARPFPSRLPAPSFFPPERTPNPGSSGLMNILIVGNGGREHALLWELRRDAPHARFFITRGNGGTDALAAAIPSDPADTQALAGWAEQNAVDLTVVGPEAPLAAGLADDFTRRGLP